MNSFDEIFLSIFIICICIFLITASICMYRSVDNDLEISRSNNAHKVNAYTVDLKRL